MLKNQTVNHVSEHLSAICPVYTVQRGLASLCNSHNWKSGWTHRYRAIETQPYEKDRRERGLSRSGIPWQVSPTYH